jgi:hypothetical protein
MSKGKGGGGSSSSNINPFDLARAQTQSNIATAQTQAALNNSNVTSPVGTSTWTPYTDANGQVRYTLNQSLSPQLQGVFNPQVFGASSLAGQIPWYSNAGQTSSGVGYNFLQMAQGPAGQIQPNLDLSGVPQPATVTPADFRTTINAGPVTSGYGGGGPVTGGYSGGGPVTGGYGGGGPVTGGYGGGGPVQGSVNTDFGGLAKTAQDAAYDTQAGYLDPQFAQQKSNLDQQLADQGIQPGTAAYDRAQGDFSRSKTFAYQQAQDAAVAAGNQEQATLFGESVTGGQFANQAQQQEYSQAQQRAIFANQAQQQGYSEAQQRAIFANQAQQQGYSEAQQQAIFANQAQQQGYSQAQQRAIFANQAQQQSFGQQVSLADLYNQAELASINQTNQAAGLGLQRAQAVQQAPINALGALTGAAGAGTQIGASNIATGAGLVNTAPTWPSSAIPTMGGYNYPVKDTNYPASVSAASNAALQGAQTNSVNMGNLVGIGNLLGITGNNSLLSGLTGGAGGGGLFSAGGLLGSQGPIFGTAADTAIAAGGPPLAPAASAALWVVCTELMRQGRLPKWHWYAGAPVFAAYPEKGKNGYYLWAVPLVRHLRRKPDSLLSRIAGAVFRWRAEDIAARRGVPGARRLRRGAAVTLVLYPTCWLLGQFAGPQNWIQLYVEERG